MYMERAIGGWYCRIAILVLLLYMRFRTSLLSEFYFESVNTAERLHSLTSFKMSYRPPPELPAKEHVY
jgi:hypothetical protein